jgi:hypothetical protein
MLGLNFKFQNSNLKEEACATEESGSEIRRKMNRRWTQMNVNFEEQTFHTPVSKDRLDLKIPASPHFTSLPSA